jgi:chromosome segregation ATPase
MSGIIGTHFGRRSGVSKPNERDKQVAMLVGCAAEEIAAYREEIQAGMRREYELLNHGWTAEQRAQINYEHAEQHCEELQAEVKQLRAEVGRLKQELIDMKHKYRNQCDATDGQTEQLAYAEGHVAELQQEIATIVLEVCGECPIEDAAATVIARHRWVCEKLKEAEARIKEES